jgi:NDP-sugar pyrophosphorylase family protein
MEREVFPALAKEHKLFGHMVDGLWIDIGKPEEYLLANRIILDTLMKTGKLKSPKKVEAEMPVAIDKCVIVGEKTVIGPYTILGTNVTVGNNVKIANSVVFPDAKICDNATIEGAIIGEGAVIGKNAQINIGCIVADQVKIRDNISLTKDSAVCPAKEISETILKRNIIC